jgi:predicted nucleic acid-binding protein
VTVEAVVDTSVLVDAMVAEAEGHARARELLGSMTKMHVPSVVIYEIVWVLKRLGVAPEKVEQVVSSLVGNPRSSVEVDDGEFSVRAIRMVVEEKTSLANFDDKVILATALKLGTPIATYDKELRREAKAMGVSSLG